MDLLSQSRLFLAVALSFFSIRMALAARAADKETAEGFRTCHPDGAAECGLLVPIRSFRAVQFGGNGSRSGQGTCSRPPSGWIRSIQMLGLIWRPLTNWMETLEEARDAYQHAKQSYPASPDVSWRYGNFLLRQGDIESAYPELRMALVADPSRAASAFSRCYRANPNVEQILDQILPPIPSAYMGIIRETSDMKQIAIAQIVWKRLMALNPRLTRDGHRALGRGTNARRRRS